MKSFKNIVWKAGLKFEHEEAEIFHPQDQDLLVKIEAISVNPVDYKIREWKPGSIVGWDAVGIVEEVGPHVKNFKRGDRVYYAGEITRPGSYADYQLVDERIVSLAPKSISVSDSAAIPLTAITAWECLFDRLKLDQELEPKNILIIGGAGGVGSMATQLLKALTPWHSVTATASRDDSISWLRKMGADQVINHRHDLIQQMQDSHINGFDYVLSTTNSDQYFEIFPKLINPEGHLCLIDDPDSFDIVPFKEKSISIHWELMFTRSLFKTDRMVKQGKLLSKVANLLDEGKVQSTRNVTLNGFNEQNFETAHALLKSGASVGKLVVTK